MFEAQPRATPSGPDGTEVASRALMRMIHLSPVVLLFLSAAAVACLRTADANERVSSSTASASSGGDDGTALTATATAGAPACGSDGTAQVTFTGTVTSTGSVDSVEITASVDGGTATPVGVIEPQDFTTGGRDKTADYSITLSLSNGTHEIVLCFTQSGAQGREPKEFCTAPITVVVACDTCAKEGPFGNIVGNPDLCNGDGPPHIPVHVSGDLGDSAALAIDGPDGYHLDATMDHAGDSCIYQFNWDTTGNGGAGTYTFTVTGANGTTFSFTADLKCR